MFSCKQFPKEQHDAVWGWYIWNQIQRLQCKYWIVFYLHVHSGKIINKQQNVIKNVISTAKIKDMIQWLLMLAPKYIVVQILIRLNSLNPKILREHNSQTRVRYTVLFPTLKARGVSFASRYHARRNRSHIVSTIVILLIKTYSNNYKMEWIISVSQRG